MIFVIALLVMLTVTLLGLAVSQAVPSRPRAITRRLAEMQRVNYGTIALDQARRQDRRQQMELFLRRLGSRLEEGSGDSSEMRQYLVQAGYRNPSAVSIYWGSRVAAAAVLGLIMLSVLIATGAPSGKVVLQSVVGAAIGWILPSFYVGRKRKKRMKHLQNALPDTLDLLVVCVEAGLGLNQAFSRVAEEIRHVSVDMAEEITLVNLEIRAGAERQEALRHLSDRTGVDDVRALTAILIQTDRFGTSVAQALRTQADTMRTKRRQRAEEAAAKTTIKLVPPLVFCVFPAIFAVILGPAVIAIFRVFMTEFK